MSDQHLSEIAFGSSPSRLEEEPPDVEVRTFHLYPDEELFRR